MPARPLSEGVSYGAPFCLVVFRLFNHLRQRLPVLSKGLGKSRKIAEGDAMPQNVAGFLGLTHRYGGLTR